MKIIVLKNNEQYGPYELSELESFVAQGSFSISDMCWQDEWDEWKPLSAIITRQPPKPNGHSITSGGDGKSSTSALAITSLVLGVISLFGGFIFGIPAVICGHIAVTRIRRSNGSLTGEWLGYAGLGFGYLGTLIGTVYTLGALFFFPR
jgi:hypothetical protein